MSISPTVIIPLHTGSGTHFKVRTLLDSGSGTNWIVESLLKYVQHTKIRTELMEVHTFHGCVKKRYQLVEVYYTDNQNNTQSIVCYVHDTYVRHVQLNMTNYILGQQSKCAPFALPGPLVDPGDTKVSHALESQGVGLVLSPASTNKIRTSDPIIRINELNILLEPTLFGVVISGAIPEHLIDTAHRVSVSFIAPRVVPDVSSLDISKKQIRTTLISPVDCNEDDIQGKSATNAAKYLSKYTSIPKNLALQNQVMDYTSWFTPIMCTLILMIKSSAIFFLFLLALLSNSFHITFILGLKPFLGKVSTNNKLFRQTLDKSHSQGKQLVNTFYHRPRLKSLKISHIYGHKKKTYYQNPAIQSKFVSKNHIRRVVPKQTS